MSGRAASTHAAKTATAAIGYAINARWHAINARVERHDADVWVSVPPNLGPTAHRGIGTIITRTLGGPHELAEVQELDRRVRLIYRPAA